MPINELNVAAVNERCGTAPRHFLLTSHEQMNGESSLDVLTNVPAGSGLCSGCSKRITLSDPVKRYGSRRVEDVMRMKWRSGYCEPCTGICQVLREPPDVRRLTFRAGR